MPFSRLICRALVALAAFLALAAHAWVDGNQSSTHPAGGSQACVKPTAPPASPERAGPLAGRTVVVDAGHGGADSGAVRGSLLEKDLALSIALAVRSELESLGATVVMTRTGDTTMSKEERVELTNKVCPDAFVSVHVNAMPQKTASERGVEVYYYFARNRAFARIVLDEVVAATGAPDRGVRWDELYVIHHTPVPAVLVEVGYMSNQAEQAQLADPAYQQKAASGIAGGIEKFLAK